MESLKGNRVDRGPMLQWMKVTPDASKKDVQGIYRWFVDLRLSDTDIQLPCAEAVLEWTSRLLLAFLLYHF